MLNFDAGISKTVINNIFENCIRNRVLTRARAEQAEAIHAGRMEVFNTCLRMAGGVAFNAGAVDLSNGQIHERVLEQATNRE
jgi:hypothetical protein